MRSRRAAIMTVLFPCLWACSEPPSTVSMVIGRYSFGPEGWDGIEVEWTAGGSTRVFDAGDFVQTDFNMSPHVEFRTADRGVGVLTLRLREDDVLIAEGSLRVDLGPGRTWVFAFLRGLEDERPFICDTCNDDPVAIPIDPEAARYPGDVLWIVWGGASSRASGEP